MPFVPSKFGEYKTIEEFAFFLENELLRLGVQGEFADGTFYTELHAEPKKPRTGLLVFADGTDWDPGAGRGIYYYDFPNWILIASLTANALTDFNVEVEAAVTVQPGQVVRANAAGRLVLAQANSLLNSRGAVFAKTAALAGFTAIVTKNFMELNDWTVPLGSVNLTPNTDYFLSATTPGGITPTAPSAVGEVVMHAGRSLTGKILSITLLDEILL
jgi:hypothetical protein